MLYRKKYCIETARCTKWDYSSPGYYFITIITHDRRHLFGEIAAGKMRLNQSGEIADDEWHKTGEIRDTVVLDEFDVMPNHIHGIIRLLPVDSTIPNKRWDNSEQNHPDDGGQNGHMENDISVPGIFIFPPIVETPCHGVSTGTGTGKNADTTNKPIKWKSGVLGAIIGQYKIQVTKQIRKSGMADFNWQPRFHDHIIRDENELCRIRQYIRNNPTNWSVDNEFDDNE